MRLINSGARVQFTLRPGTESGLAIEVGDQANPEAVLTVLDGYTAPVTEEQFQHECGAWLVAHDKELTDLREGARARYRAAHGTYRGTTDFGPEAEAKLDQIAEIAGRRDIYIGHDPYVNPAVEGWFVFAPWLLEFTRERFHQKPNMQYALAFIDIAHRKAVFAPEDIRAFAVPSPLPEGAHWVADGAARSRGVTLKRVWSVELIGNGGHAVTWEDSDGRFHVTEDYNNIG